MELLRYAALTIAQLLRLEILRFSLLPQSAPNHQSLIENQQRFNNRRSRINNELMRDLFTGERQRQSVEVATGAVWLRNWLSLETQAQLVDRCRALLDGPGGGYTPTVRGGGKMHVQMMCLGRHWNPLTYTYESTRADHDDLPVQPVPDDWVTLAAAAAREAGFTVVPDICLINFYPGDGRMGLHQDKDESPASIDAGMPVVSLSIGDTARFLFGGLRRREPVETILLESGDAFVFGGPARLRYHGVARIVPGTAPAALQLNGRFNLTFRKF
jgi:DNA alkylation damage repair protein AlkB